MTGTNMPPTDNLYDVRVKITLDVEVQNVAAPNRREAAHQAVQRALDDLVCQNNIKDHEIVSTRAVLIAKNLPTSTTGE